MSIEVLKQLLDTEVLTEETKTAIASALETVIEEARTSAKQEAERAVMDQLVESFNKDIGTLAESLDARVAAALEEHLKTQRASMDTFRDLEVETATALVEAKTQLVEQSKTDLVELTKKIDGFLDVVVQEEFAEFREELLESQRASLGMKIFEGFRKEFEQVYAQQTGIAAKVQALQTELADARGLNASLQESLNKVTRDRELAKTLQPLEGKARQVMETILATVSTDKLQETYNRFVGRVVVEGGDGVTTAATLTEGKGSEKEVQVLAEEKIDPNTVSLRTGDEPDKKRGVVTESAPGLSEVDKRRLLRTAGLI